MTQPDYKFYKKKILKYLVGNYVIAKTKKSYVSSIINGKYKIVTKDGSEQIPASILLDNIKKIFGVDDAAAIKKILRYWSKNKLSSKNWLDWCIDSSGGLVNMPYVIQELPQIVEWDHFTPSVRVLSRYGQVNLNQRYYSTIDAARLEEEVLEFNIKIKPIAPVQHIDLKITINNEQT